jgi:beta-lactam-binding protein with PASTA domain
MIAVLRYFFIYKKVDKVHRIQLISKPIKPTFPTSRNGKIVIKKSIKILSLFTWLIPFVGFLIGYSCCFLARQKATQTTPQVIGKKLHEALILATHHDLSIRLMGEKEDANAPEGTILEQIPTAQQKIRPRQNIFVTIAIKPQLCKAPHCLGKPYAEVKKILTQQALKITRRWVSRAYQLKHCIAQTPLPEKAILSKKMIVYFSAGNDPLFLVPDFRNAPLTHVKEYCQNRGVSYEIFYAQDYVSETHESTALPVIIDQKPLAGSIVDLGKPLCMQLQVDKLS